MELRKQGTKERLFEMMARVNKTTIVESLTDDDLTKIAQLVGNEDEPEEDTQKSGGLSEFDYNGAEMDHLNQQDIDYDQQTNDEDKNFDNLKNELIRNFKPEVIENTEDNFHIKIKKPDGNIGDYKITKFHLTSNDGEPLYGVYVYNDGFDGFDLLHDEIGSRSMTLDKVIEVIKHTLISNQ